MQIRGSLLMVVIFNFSMCLYELQQLVIGVDDCLLSKNVALPLSASLYNGIHLLIIGGIFADCI